MVEGLRLLLLIGAFVNLVASTVLFRAYGRPFLDWCVRVFRLPAEMRRLLSDDRVVRIWGVGAAALSLAAWWYLGTADGEALVRPMAAPRAP
jgi:hypothetical protein